jgi:phenylpropionate dioxygenase-like ring-hydroxylating dioxygenase large terminal subunit
MLSAEQNDLITRTNPERRRRCCGAIGVAALVDELVGNAVKAVRLMGEDLVVFRRAGSLRPLRPALPASRHRPRFWAAGSRWLRCAFHGWLFDVDGGALQTPAEPDNNNLCANIRLKSYPVVEGRHPFAYLGGGGRRRFRNSIVSSRRRAHLAFKA